MGTHTETEDGAEEGRDVTRTLRSEDEVIATTYFTGTVTAVWVFTQKGDLKS